ncbi:hypothetical protein [Stutzerimonas kunmingensis]|uniref:hypothetical protein n=1 Tax=Stutzerimonas kunmingensis TaxID=1211807 RepID=UPI0011B037B0|nr:hypothetical protein [Stutzerimonas kunmingensis]
MIDLPLSKSARAEVGQKTGGFFRPSLGEALSKTIIYGNKPKNIESFAWSLAQRLPKVQCPIIDKACGELSDNFDSQYLIIECLRRGVMYHHGSIADTVRLYLENTFSKSKKLKYLVCSATF